MDVELPGADFELLVEYGWYMKAIVFPIKKYGLGWLCSSVCGSDEVQTVSTSIELETVIVWNKGT